jgi:hypothetical protein
MILRKIFSGSHHHVAKDFLYSYTCKALTRKKIIVERQPTTDSGLGYTFKSQNPNMMIRSEATKAPLEQPSTVTIKNHAMSIRDKASASDMPRSGKVPGRKPF